jgi:hypothetical protein
MCRVWYQGGSKLVAVLNWVPIDMVLHVIQYKITRSQWQKHTFLIQKPTPKHNPSEPVLKHASKSHNLPLASTVREFTCFSIVMILLHSDPCYDLKLDMALRSLPWEIRRVCGCVYGKTGPPPRNTWLVLHSLAPARRKNSCSCFSGLSSCCTQMVIMELHINWLCWKLTVAVKGSCQPVPVCPSACWCVGSSW